jgi:hypothetical protein
MAGPREFIGTWSIFSTKGAATPGIILAVVIDHHADQINRVPGIIRGTLSHIGARLDEIFLLLSPCLALDHGKGKYLKKSSR